ncbi:MAG: LamB/YcsF family protein [Nocardioides sp.]|nr:LamB/YcsF family protein [Nocardioides sp.]
MERDRGRLVVDLNADLGEEVTDDAALLAVVTSANVACGFHAGTTETMRFVAAEAVRLGVVIGAQVSYDDRPNFGRVVRDVHEHVLREQVAEQVGVLQEIVATEGGAVTYVKPHGALYHRVAVDPGQAAAVLAGSGSLPVLGLPGALILDLAAARGRATRLEGFPDRGYRGDGSLVPRGEPGALLDDHGQIADQAVLLAERVHSVCVHGDSPGAVRNAQAVRRALQEAGFLVRHCWDSTGLG